MVSFAVRHAADTALSGPRVFASRRSGAASGRVAATRRSYGIAMSYQIDEQNGSARTTVPFVFPDAKYSALDYTPVRAGYRFLGWYTAASGGSEVSKDDQAAYGVSAIYAHWQDHATVTFDATTGGGAMPSGWVAPYYFAGQEYGTLPTPTHALLVFSGWYDGGGNLVTSSSVVPQGGAALVAQYSSVPYDEVLPYLDTDGMKWIDTGIVPDSDTEVRVKVAVANEYGDQNLPVFGTDAGYLYYHLTCYSYSWYYGLNGSESHAGSYDPTFGTEYVIDFNNGGDFILNGTTVAQNMSFGAMSGGYTLRMSKRDDYTASGGQWRYYYFQVYQSGTLVLDFIPVSAGGEECMYDRVSGNLFHFENGGYW